MNIDHPYSPAMVANGMVYVSGALSIDKEGRPVAGRRAALDAAMERLAERLATVGTNLGNIVRATYYVTDVSLRDEANQQYCDVFREPRPARTFVAVAQLPYGATVEIEAIATLPSNMLSSDNLSSIVKQAG
jgi:2-iminobutanoate/2-iminopropanoate deaminase